MSIQQEMVEESSRKVLLFRYFCGGEMNGNDVDARPTKLNTFSLNAV